MNKRLLSCTACLLALLFGLSMSSRAQRSLTIACIGASITEGARLDDPLHCSYPVQLGQLLGKDRLYTAVTQRMDKTYDLLSRLGLPKTIGSFYGYRCASMTLQGRDCRIAVKAYEGQVRHSAATLYPSYNGLVMAGYQGWFRAAGDGSAAKRYAYGDENRSGIDLWPDVSEYPATYETPFHTADGKTARFFSSLDNSTTDLHFKWMQDYGVDGVFMQRFFDDTRPGNRKRESSLILQHALRAASTYKRAIAVMYDLSGLKGSGEDCSSIIDDWKYLVDSLRITNQEGEKTYLHHRGKPLVVIWGVGFPDRPYDIRNIGLERLMDFLKNDPVYGNCAVMLGVPTFWRDLNADCIHDPYLHELIRRADLILPWTVQRFSPLLHNDMDRYRDLMIEDMKWCGRNNVDYVPCVYPGFSWHNLSVYEFPDDIKPVGSIPRQGGRFYWQMLSTALRTGAKMLYVAMFDEVNEGTAIFKASDNPPVGQHTQFIDMDHKPSDTYLWLTGQAAQMLRGQKPLTGTMPERK